MSGIFFPDYVCHNILSIWPNKLLGHIGPGAMRERVKLKNLRVSGDPFREMLFFSVNSEYIRTLKGH